MSAAPALPAHRRLLAPEVVQTSPMDCGPAALKCLLEGFGIRASYGRLREACQTGVDGTSIDVIEVVANQLGLPAEQVSIPVDHLHLDGADALPALAVVRQSDGQTHFVVVWRRHGQWLQIMDPALGRRWVPVRRFADDLLRHEISVPAAEWRAWASSDDFLAPLRERLAALGLSRVAARRLIHAALADRGWFGLGALDACTRMVTAVVRAAGVSRRRPAERLLAALCEGTRDSPRDIFTLVPPEYWSVVPDLQGGGRLEQRLRLRGAVLVRLGAAADVEPTTAADAPPLPPELEAALRERTTHPMRALWTLLRADGLLGPAALVVAMLLSVGAVLIEALLFRGIFDIAWALELPLQRMVAVGALVVFAAAVLLLETPIIGESMRFGRHLELRLRMALLAKLPQLPDRYFHSRPISDMAERNHSIQVTRLVPGLGLHLVQALWELALTFAGVVLIDPATAIPAAVLVITVLAMPALVQPFLNERDLRVRSHGAALHGTFLDALMGLVPIRTHRAEASVRRHHEGLLVDWARASRDLLRTSLIAGGAQSAVALGLAAYLLVEHFVRAGGASGSDLLLVYWVLKLPATARSIAGLAQRYPAQRNIVLRLMEPLQAPGGDDLAHASSPPNGDAVDAAAPRATEQTGAASVGFRRVAVVAGGHRILESVDLAVAPGEHVAVVGPSGAGKSSLLGVLLGWHRPAAGEVRVDGAALDPAALEHLRRHTAWVDPAVQLWNRSLLDNLGYATAGGGVERIDPVIEAADLERVLHRLPDGLQTHLGEGGALLSGGEGQRVRLARALMQSDVRLVLLDEPFRGLDRRRRRRLLRDARHWWQGATLLCVTHDIAETMDFDRVLVVENGQIVEDDAPRRLARTDSRYRALLAAELDLRRRVWGGAGWRRLVVRGARVTEREGAR
ncbi:MAG: ATP-binding cassette domain-containing protein [Planctomycetes bacterium]|nr:ATP-binding cassette domain-containing protein [Planctomycetota bacterium]